MTENSALMVKIAVLGGTGKEGSALARRWANKGYGVVIGSRDPEKAAQVAAEINAEIGEAFVSGADNLTAAAAADDIVVLSVPYSAHRSTLESVKDQLQGKILVDLTVPTPYLQSVVIPEGKSAGLEAQALLGDGVRVVSAFQNVGAGKLKNLSEPVALDVLVTGDDEQAKHDVIALVEAAGMRGLDSGPLANSVAAEALTAVLFYIGKVYKVKGAGIRITGIE